MQIESTPLSGLIIIHPRSFKDDRGYFYESYQKERYSNLNMPEFVQDNISLSKRHTLRGLHYQLPHAQGKLVSVLQGEVYDVVVDIREKSPTFGKWFGIHLNDENHIQFYIPPGFAHGFCVLSETALFSYKCTDYYTPSAEKGIIWNDPHLNIDWPVKNPLLSPKDEQYLRLDQLTSQDLFTHAE